LVGFLPLVALPSPGFGASFGMSHARPKRMTPSIWPFYKDSTTDL